MTSKTVRSIQYLRGVAALLVVVFHATAALDWLFNPLPPLRFGQAGVDIFFVISGFVMYVSARHESAGQFAIKRLIRIVPLYWIVTLLFCAMRFSHWGEAGLDGAALIKSLLFIPYRTAPEAEVWPILIPGWTLNIEMLFYLAFGVGLLFRHPAAIATVLISVLFLTGKFWPSDGAAAALYSQHLLLEFIVGLGLGALATTDRVASFWWPLAPIGLAILLCSDAVGEWAPAARAIGGIALVAGAISLEFADRLPRLDALGKVGDASYSIYLLHTPMLLVLWAGYRHVPLSGWPQFLLFLVLALGGATLLGLLSYRFVERPLLRLAKARRRPVRHFAAAVPARREEQADAAGAVRGPTGVATP